MLRTNSKLNILGLCLAFASFYLLLVQVEFDFSFNKSVKDCDQTYMLATDMMSFSGKHQTMVSRGIGEMSAKDIDDIYEHYYMSVTQLSHIKLIKNGQENAITLNTMQVSNNFFTAIGAEPADGNIDSLPSLSIVVTEKFASENDISVGDTMPTKFGDFVIRGIIKDLKKNCICGYTQMFIISNLIGEDNFMEWSYTYFYKIRPGADIAEIERSINSRLNKLVHNMDKFPQLSQETIKLVPLSTSYFNEDVVGNHPTGKYGQSLALLMIAMLIFLNSEFNYNNFFWAQLPYKMKAINIKKILGCPRRRIVWELFLESLTLIAVSLLLAAILIKIMQAMGFQQLIPADMAICSNLKVCITTLFTALVTVVGNCAYPAYYIITKQNPAISLKGQFWNKKKSNKQLLIGIQFLITFCMIICQSFIHYNNEYISNHELGFNKERMLTTGIGGSIERNRDTVRKLLTDSPLIEDATFTSGSIVIQHRMYWGRVINGNKITFHSYASDYNVVDFLGIDIIEGRNFEKDNPGDSLSSLIFNRRGKEKFGLKVGDTVPGIGMDPAIVRGFCENFSYLPLNVNSEEFAFYYCPKLVNDTANQLVEYNKIYIRYADGADIDSAKQAAADILNKFSPNKQCSADAIKLFDDELGDNYADNKKLSSLVGVFSLIAILISVVGLVGVVLFEAQSRRKEISIRRVNGATVFDVMLHINSKFLIAICIAFVIAVPISIFAISRYFSFFANHCSIDWWIFAAVFAAVVVSVLVVVTLSTWKSATENPATAIRSE